MSSATRYQTQPVHQFPALHIEGGYATLARAICACLAERQTPLVVLDGFAGVVWEAVISALQAAFADLGATFTWIDARACLLPSNDIDVRLYSFLTDDPVFGRLFHGTIADLWNDAVVADLRTTIAQQSEPTLVYGPGASCLIVEGVTVYLDVPKDRGQELLGAGVVQNLGASSSAAFGLMYKRLYFVEWPLLNQIKRALLPTLDLFVDATSAEEPLVVTGAALRQSLSQLAHQPFRVKPWFAPGPWGGQWMKEQFGLPPEQPNYAWSFELIAPENGILLGDGQQAIECAFDYLLWAETDAVLGIAVAARYGSYFPVRFDYLDTMGGTNLSCQVHPRFDYIRDHFGEPFTQDETYYIVTNEPGAQVFLGLREETDVAAFQHDARQARDAGIPFAITDHVNSVPAAPHDLFLIPSGTVHCSGANNLVLEISATPYIYTFKIYDYLRTDLRGNLRHVHLDYAFANLVQTRRTGWVNAYARPQPRVVREGVGWAEEVIGDIPELFFAIHRLAFVETIADVTNGKFVALNLVAGEQCEVLTEGNAPYALRFAESLVIPASVGAYTLHNTGTSPCKVVKAFVK